MNQNTGGGGPSGSAGPDLIKCGASIGEDALISGNHAAAQRARRCSHTTRRLD